MPCILNLGEIHHPVATLLAEQLEQVTVIFERQLASDLAAVNTLCAHIEQYRGKMLRPTVVLLSGLATGTPQCDAGVLTDKHRTVAAVAEMIHMATLVHDDVLDEAQVRRRGATVNHLWGNEPAVMLGDYLISNAFHLCSTLNDPSINLALGDVTNTICEGELIQLHHRDDFAIDEGTYFEIVRRKTASLIGECCRLGSQLAGADGHLSRAAWSFGLSLGVAYQIQDDLLDLVGDQDVVGKSLGTDLDKGKLTLPLMRHLANAAPQQRSEALRLIEQGESAALRTRLIESGAVDYTRQTAARLIDQAREHLGLLPDSPAREVLEALAEAGLSRAY